jgi:hypothetical protein
MGAVADEVMDEVRDEVLDEATWLQRWAKRHGDSGVGPPAAIGTGYGRGLASTYFGLRGRVQTPSCD